VYEAYLQQFAIAIKPSVFYESRVLRNSYKNCATLTKIPMADSSATCCMRKLYEKYAFHLLFTPQRLEER
jgi:hypothetical protein